MQDNFWILENVGEFGEEETRKILSRLYLIERVLANANQNGWRSMRFRQFLIGRHRRLRASIPKEVIDRFTILQDVTAVFQALFTRECLFTQDAYKIATEHELHQEMQWLKGRPHVHLRYNVKQLEQEFPHHVQVALTVDYCSQFRPARLLRRAEVSLGRAPLGTSWSQLLQALKRSSQDRPGSREGFQLRKLKSLQKIC